MSLSINFDHVTAVYALGEWHAVTPGTFYVDAYEGVQDDGDRKVFFQLGMPYPEVEKIKPMPNADRYLFKSPGGMDGCTWQCPETDQHVSMSLLEIKGWKTCH